MIAPFLIVILFVAMYGGFAHDGWKSKDRWFQIIAASLILWVIMAIFNNDYSGSTDVDLCSTGITQECNDPDESQIPLP